MDEDLNTLHERAQAWKRRNAKRLEKLRRQKNLTRNCRDAHIEVFSNLNCLECANCCKTTGPMFLQKDIARLAKLLRISCQEFIHRFLRVDEDGDYVLQTVPCPFLLEDHQCSIYEQRPKACRNYPHTDDRDQHRIFHLTLKNAEVCPGVLQILKEIINHE